MELINEQIVLPALYTIPDSAIAKRDEMVRLSAETQQVNTRAEQAVAVADGRILQGHIKNVEEARMSLSRPLDEAKAKLIEVQNDYLAPLKAERDRLARLVTAFQKKEQDRVAAEEYARREHIQMLERERDAAKALLAEAHPSEAGSAAQALAEATEAQRAVIVAPLPAPAKARGVATRTVLCWEVTDLALLYAHRPDLCTIEPKASAIRAVCCAGMNIPGLKLWEEQQSNFRRI